MIQSASSPATQVAPVHSRELTDWLLLLGFCAFLFFFGLNYFGLVGADEPRYAQIAREMLARHDWITPVLGGRPWLEKPVLFYWEAMLSYSIFGVSDWAARIPSAFDATLLVAAVYLFLRRFRPGFQLDGALITAAAAGVIGFARAASTDMPLASMFTISLLGWYAWRESGIRSYLGIFYLFLALATLAKGPVAPFFAFVIIAAFCTLHRDYRLLWRTLATPWALLFPAVAFPWYIAVQLRNPEFFRVFILEHNLARFGTDLYHHGQPFWFYVPVILLALLPWTIFVAQALIESLRLWWSDRDLRVDREHSFNIFLILWLIIPVVFFSFSKSKLPGYILPAVPAGTLLLAEYVRRHVTEGVRPPLLVTLLHSIVAAQLLIPALMIQHILLNHRLPWGMPLAVAGCAAVVLATSMMLTLRSNLGLRMLRFVTLVPVVLVLAVVLRTHAPVVDAAFSVRPLARDIARVEAGNLPTAVFRVSREIEYGLAFYRNQTVQNYNIGQVPMRDHLLVTAEGTWPILAREMPNRRISFLGNYAPLHLEYYWISAPGAYSSQHHSHQ